jgi:hypothetical protein
LFIETLTPLIAPTTPANAVWPAVDDTVPVLAERFDGGQDIAEVSSSTCLHFPAEIDDLLDIEDGGKLDGT